MGLSLVNKACKYTSCMPNRFFTIITVSIMVWLTKKNEKDDSCLKKAEWQQDVLTISLKKECYVRAP